MKIREKLRSVRDSRLVLPALVFGLKGLRQWGIFRSERLFRHVPFRGNIEVSIPEGGVFRMKARGGQIENRLFWSGFLGHEPGSMAAWIALSKHARTVLDIGSNSGIFALAASAAGARRVYAFEPVKRIHARLDENIRLSGFNNVDALLCAVGASDGEAEICDPGGDAPTSASLSQRFADDHLGSTITTPVRVVAIDSWAQAQGIVDIDLIKLDVEGFEESALLGMREIVKRDRPTLLVEVLGEYEDRIRQLVQDLWGTQYDWRPIDEGESDPSRNVLLVPRVPKG
ncbi:FkbM family methyltransferase [Limnobacter sp. P1]|uniref:FkbM family methyltransferase n=1 Tax=Limnobacter olei TaxID=3031298 RepID=UPI0023B02C7D|nr:FkbM family methyltransferase [Limnobacter sp. P1]